MHQACAEARAEAEAAAGQRYAAALALERAELDKQVQLTLYMRQCGTALAWFCGVCIVALIDCLTSKACLRLSRAQRRARNDSLDTAGCPGRRDPVPLTGPAFGGQSALICAATCHIARGRPPLVGLAARLGGRSCRGWGSTLGVGSSAASTA